MSKTLQLDDKQYKYQIWDTAGQEKVRAAFHPLTSYTGQYRGLAPMYYRGAAAAIVVYDITSRVRNKTIQPHTVRLSY